MTAVKQLFPSQYVSAGDLSGDTPVKIKQVKDAEEVGEEKQVKPVVYFFNWPKGMVLNKTNAKRIVAMHGDDTDDWIGKWISIYPSECDFRGEAVDCVRVKKDPPKNVPDEDAGGEDDEPTEEELEQMLAKRKAAKNKQTA